MVSEIGGNAILPHLQAVKENAAQSDGTDAAKAAVDEQDPSKTGTTKSAESGTSGQQDRKSSDGRDNKSARVDLSPEGEKAAKSSEQDAKAKKGGEASGEEGEGEEGEGGGIATGGGAGQGATQIIAKLKRLQAQQKSKEKQVLATSGDEARELRRDIERLKKQVKALKSKQSVNTTA